MFYVCLCAALFVTQVMWSRDAEVDYLDAALTVVLQIHLTEPSGDILVFLTGQEGVCICIGPCCLSPPPPAGLVLTGLIYVQKSTRPRKFCMKEWRLWVQMSLI